MGAVGKAGEGLGDVQSAKSPASTWIATLAVSPAGVPLKVKVAWSVAIVSVGPESMVVSGVVSMVICRDVVACAPPLQEAV